MNYYLIKAKGESQLKVLKKIILSSLLGELILMTIKERCKKYWRMIYWYNSININDNCVLCKNDVRDKMLGISNHAPNLRNNFKFLQRQLNKM